MSVAVVGAGFAGLGAAYFLSKKVAVTVFDAVGIGGGASTASAGLLHPYPGKQGNLSFEGHKALDATKTLLRVAEKEVGVVANYGGIIKKGECCTLYDDVEKIGEGVYFIRSGVTVFAQKYVEGLWQACEKQGAKFQKQKVSSADTFEEFDAIVIAAGYGILDFNEASSLKLKYIKGQILHGTLPTDLKQSEIQKHYLAVTANPLHYQYGATYERNFSSVLPDLAEAQKLLSPQALYPDFQVTGCSSGVRVASASSYIPIVKKVSEKTWVFTGLGSRGLLYHAFFAQGLTRSILST